MWLNGLAKINYTHSHMAMLLQRYLETAAHHKWNRYDSHWLKVLILAHNNKRDHNVIPTSEFHEHLIRFSSFAARRITNLLH